MNIRTLSNVFLLRAFSFLLLALAAPSPMSAAIVFTNFGAARSYDVNSGNPVGNAFDGSTYAEGGAFTPLSNVNVSSIVIALSCFANCPGADPFTVALRGDNGDRPGLAIESFSVTASTLGPLGTNNAALVLTSILQPLVLASTRYWVTVSSSSNDSIAWNLNSIGDVSDEAISTDGGATWFSPSLLTPGAFEVNSTVPEPVSVFLLLSGTVAMGVLRKTIQAKD